MKGLGSMTPASPSVSVRRRVNRFLGIVFRYSRCNCRASRAAGRSAQFLSHSATLGNGAMPIWAGRAQLRMLATLRSATVKLPPSRLALRPSAVEHPQRLSELFFGGVGRRSIALVLGKNGPIEQCRQHRPLDLGHSPKAPLPGPRLVFEAGWIERACAVFLSEVEVDRHRLPENKAVVVDDRNMPVGIEREMRRRPGFAGREVDLQMLVIEPQLLGHPQGAKGPRARYAMDLESHHSSLHSPREP